MRKQIPEYPFRKEYEQIGFEIVRLEYFFAKHPEEERKSPHRVKFYVIMFITDGEGEHLIDFKIYDYQEKNILFVGKDQVHSWELCKEVKGFLIIFTEDFLHQNQIKFKDLSYSYPYNPFLYKPVVDLQQPQKYETFLSLLDYIYKEYNSPNHSDKQEILQCLLRTFILKIQVQSKFENNHITNEKKQLFIRLQRLLDEKISISRNAVDYCKWLNSPYRKLNDTCKELTNLSLKGFIDKIIILKAKKYLSDKDKNVSEVSYMLGFKEVTNFTKYFKKHTNLSPKSFQNSIL